MAQVRQQLIQASVGDKRRALMALVVLAVMAVQPAAANEAAKAASGLPVPRFVSLKVDRINLRQGPGTEYPTAWVFQRAGLPVEVLREFDGWRQIRDSDGTTGWVQGAMLSGRRTALVTPWEVKSGEMSQSTLRRDARADAAPAAYLESGLVASILGCDGQWCRITVGAVRGYLEQPRLWGVYPGEIVK